MGGETSGPWIVVELQMVKRCDEKVQENEEQEDLGVKDKEQPED